MTDKSPEEIQRQSNPVLCHHGSMTDDPVLIDQIF